MSELLESPTAASPSHSQFESSALRKHIEQVDVAGVTRGKPRQLNISMSNGRNSATVGGTMIRSPKAAAKAADPQTLAVAAALAAAEAETDAEAEADADKPAEAEADAAAAAEAVALSAAEKLKLGDNTANPKIEIRSCRAVKRASTSARRGADSRARTDSSKARLAFSVGIDPASRPIDADALKSMPRPAETAADALSIADNEAPRPNERPIDRLALSDRLALIERSMPSDAARASWAQAARFGMQKRGSCASMFAREGSDAASCSMANAADGHDKSMPSARFAISAMLAVSERFAIIDASNESPSEAPSAVAALISADALALSAAEALKPKLAAAASDTPGVNEGSPTVMESRLLREARQAQGISKQTEFNRFDEKAILWSSQLKYK